MAVHRTAQAIEEPALSEVEWVNRRYPGEAIRAGQGIPRAGEDGPDMSDEQGPDEGSLGGLALGAVGLLAWRKSRSRTARLKNA